MNATQYYELKLQNETDSADLYKAAKNEQPVIIDVRRKDAYLKEHIPGAINLFHGDMTEQSTRHLDSSKKYVTYCDGIGCNGSTKGALNLSRLGFSVKELLGGIDWWKRDGYPTVTAGDKPENSTGQARCGC